MAVDPDGDEEYDGTRRRHVGLVARVVAVLAVLGLVGASVSVLWSGGDEDDVVAEGPAGDGILTAEDLTGHTFVVVAIEQDGVAQPLAAQHPTLAFDDTTVRIDTQCNGMQASWQLFEDQLLVLEGRSTRMGCGGTVGDQERALVELLLDVVLDVGTEPAEARLHPSAALADGVLELRLRDRVAWAVDVTDQAAIDGPPRVDAAQPVRDLLADDASQATFAVTPSAGFDPSSVVTVLSEPGPDGGRVATAYVVSADGTTSRPRSPTTSAPFDPAPASTVRPGQRISLERVPGEGGATAYVNGVEVPTEVYSDPSVTTLLVPAWARGEIVVTLSLATPEDPDAYAAWFRVSPQG